MVADVIVTEGRCPVRARAKKEERSLKQGELEWWKWQAAKQSAEPKEATK